MSLTECVIVPPSDMLTKYINCIKMIKMGGRGLELQVSIANPFVKLTEITSNTPLKTDPTVFWSRSK